MKSIVAVAVAISTLLLLTLPMELQGAPHITSQELGRAVEQLQEMIKAEAEKLAQSVSLDLQKIMIMHIYMHPYYINNLIPQGAGKFSSIQQYERVTAQVRGVDIRNCGAVGATINSALAILTTLFGNNFGVLVDCQASTDGVQVRVDVPADDVVADVIVRDLGKSLIWPGGDVFRS